MNYVEMQEGTEVTIGALQERLKRQHEVKEGI